MNTIQKKTLFGVPAARYGLISLIAALLVWLSWPLVVVVGVFIQMCLVIPLLLIGVSCGFLGLGAGVYYKDALAVVAGTIGLSLMGAGVWAVSTAMSF
jgi:hypothetical protein